MDGANRDNNFAFTFFFFLFDLSFQLLMDCTYHLYFHLSILAVLTNSFLLIYLLLTLLLEMQ